MLRKFGVEEAASAGVFAKSKEQKETVLAMLVLMDIPVVIKQQVEKLRKKLGKKIFKKLDKIDALQEKKYTTQADLKELEVERDGIELTEQDWDLYNLR